jgi:hypothetical protein
MRGPRSGLEYQAITGWGSTKVSDLYTLPWQFNHICTDCRRIFQRMSPTFSSLWMIGPELCLSHSLPTPTRMVNRLMPGKDIISDRTTLALTSL